MITSKLEERAKAFQRSLDIEEVKRKREEGQVELRKQKRSEQVAKKRALGGKVAVAAEEDTGSFEFDLGLVEPDLLRYCPSLSDPSLPQPQKLQSLLSLLHHPATLSQALSSLTNILAVQSSPPLLLVACSGVVPLLLQLLTSPDSTMVYQSAWCVTNLSSGPSQAIEILLNCGALPSLLLLLDHADDRIVDQAIWAFSNIAGDCDSTRSQVIDLGVIEKVVRLLKRDKNWDEAYVENMAWMMSNLCRGLPEEREAVADRVLQMIPYFLSNERPGIISSACWILSYLTDAGLPLRLDKVMNIGVASRLLNLTLAVTEDQQLPALRTVGNLLTGDDSHVQTLLNLGVLDKLTILVTCRRKEIRKECLWCFSNIAAGTSEQQRILTSHNSFGLLVNALSEKDSELRKEAVYAVANLTKEREEGTLQRLLAQGVLESLVRVLEDTVEPVTLQVALEGITQILRSAGVRKSVTQSEIALRFESIGGLNRLEALQGHHNQKVYEKVVEMMGEFYGMEEVKQDTEKDEMQRIPEGGFQFS